MEYYDQIFKLIQIVFVDLVLAGDNAIVIGMVAGRFQPEYRRKVIFYGVGVAVVLRIVFALITVQLLQILGLLLVGGLLLLWVCWKLWRDLREAAHTAVPETQAEAPMAENPSMLSAIGYIVVADISMSLDNVLAVAGIAEGHTAILVFGLALSVVLMMVAATLIAEFLQKRKWIGYVGLAIIFYVAVKMIYDGSLQVYPLLA
ncbi:MAG: YjbE family putative metal transport protein [Gammaproteobacteria bacterium]|nr:YjbE family putative metal transport protein [Gammaproteobacteria bacterium]MCY4228262.1 YjbE family putative metal transport protein [Gammaproteobacteria bacterium]